MNTTTLINPYQLNWMILLYTAGLLMIVYGAGSTLKKWQVPAETRMFLLLDAAFVSILMLALTLNAAAALWAGTLLAVCVFPAEPNFLRKADAFSLWLLPALAVSSLIYLTRDHWMMPALFACGFGLLFILCKTSLVRQPYFRCGWISTVAAFAVCALLIQFSSMPVLALAAAGFGTVTFVLSFARRKEARPLLVFDNESVLCDSRPLCFEAWKKTFEQYPGQSVPDDETLRQSIWQSSTVPELSGLYWYEQECRQDAYERFLHVYREEMPVLLKPARGMEALLDSLKSKGYRCLVVSARHPSLSYAQLYQMQLCSGFESIGTLWVHQEDLKKKDYAPLASMAAARNLPPENYVYIGNDSLMQKAAVKSGGLAIGYDCTGVVRHSIEGTENLSIHTAQQLEDQIEAAGGFTSRIQW